MIFSWLSEDAEGARGRPEGMAILSAVEVLESGLSEASWRVCEVLILMFDSGRGLPRREARVREWLDHMVRMKEMRE